MRNAVQAIVEREVERIVKRTKRVVVTVAAPVEKRQPDNTRWSPKHGYHAVINAPSQMGLQGGPKK